MVSVSDHTWSEILTAIRRDQPELPRPWFQDLKPVGMEHGVILVQAAETDQHVYLERDCQAAFNQAAQAVLERLMTVQFLAPVEKEPVELPLTFERETDHLVLNDAYSFDQFVTGPCNRLAHAACVGVAENPGRAYNPLFLHGGVGLGKTHLLQATCHQISSANPEAKILYISCETFTNHFIEAIERGALHQFRYRYRHIDVLVIDDIQFLAARERSREEFFHTFNTLFQLQKQIILSADESPREIPSLEDRLVSRFNWGLVARLDPPDLETRMAIVRKKARTRCAELPEDVVHYIASSVESNTRELEGALTRVLAMSQQFGGTIDLAVAKEAVGQNESSQTRRVAITDILQLVTDRYSVRLADLQGKRRHRSLAFPRQICMYLARELTNLSLEEIGGYFGGRDHTTVLHAHRTINEQRNQDTDLAFSLRDLADRLVRNGTAWSSGNKR